MVSKKVFWALTAVSIIIILGLLFVFISTQREIADLLKGGNSLIGEKKEISTIPASGNIDDAINSFLKETDDENLAVKDLEGDLDLVDSDSQEVDGFGQSVNENDF